MDWTVEVYRLDKRYKGGMVLVEKIDYKDKDLDFVEKMNPPVPRYVRFIKETWVERRNLITGEAYKERYDTPWSCSPASESFWSN